MACEALGVYARSLAGHHLTLLGIEVFELSRQHAHSMLPVVDFVIGTASQSRPMTLPSLREIGDVVRNLG